MSFIIRNLNYTCSYWFTYACGVIQYTCYQTNVEECGPCPFFASFTLAFALQLRRKHGKTSVRIRKTSVRLRKTSVRVQYTYYQTNVEECGPCLFFASFTLAFALELRKKHGKTSVRIRKTSVRLRKTSVRVQYTYYQTN